MSPLDLAAAPLARRTPRLLLRVPQPDDAPAVLDSITRSRTALQFIHWAHGAEFTPERAANFCRKAAGFHASGESLHYLAWSAQSGELVGMIDLHSFDLEAPRAEIGYVGDIRQAGRGLMREAVLAVTHIAFELGFARVQALSDVRNARALAFAASLDGYQREGVLQAFERDPWGLLCAQVMFAAVNPAVVLADPQAPVSLRTDA